MWDQNSKLIATVCYQPTCLARTRDLDTEAKVCQSSFVNGPRILKNPN